MQDAYLDRVSSGLDLAPRDSLVRSRAGVTTVKLLSRVDVYGRLGAIAHQTGIGDVVLHDTTTEDDDTGPLGPHGDGVDLADVLDDVDAQVPRRRLEAVKVQHVAEAAVSQRGAEDGYVVLPGPVVDGALVVDLLAEAVDDLARGPVDGVLAVVALAPAGLLLLEHLVEDGDDPVLKGAIVGVGNDEVPDAVEALLAQVGARGAKGRHVRVAEALDQVLLDAAGRGDDGRDVLVLNEVA